MTTDRYDLREFFGQDYFVIYKLKYSDWIEEQQDYDIQQQDTVVYIGKQDEDKFVIYAIKGYDDVANNPSFVLFDTLNIELIASFNSKDEAIEKIKFIIMAEEI